MTNFDEFRFTPALLSEPREPGISAYMRIKNEEQFGALSILSHIDYYDEIIACYNDCTDNTEKILLGLAKQYPHKIKVYHYRPKVHPPYSQEHAKTPDDSVHGLANYYNYALSKTTRQIATKLDADHLAISCKLAPFINTIRKDITAGKRKLYYFSGINLIRNSDNQIGVAGHFPLVGNRDHYYHPVSEHLYYRNNELVEEFTIRNKKLLEIEYMGIMYFHLKYLKKDFEFDVYQTEAEKTYMQKYTREFRFVPFDEFSSSRHHKELKNQLKLWDRLHCALYASDTLRRLKYKLTGTPPQFKQVRLARLAKDLQGIDLNRDVIDKLEK